MTLSFEQILGKAKPTETSVELCLAGDLFGDHARLVAELEELRGSGAGTLGGGGGGEIAEKIVELESKMKAETVEFRFRAIPRKKFESARIKYQKDDGTMTDEWIPWLVSASFLSATGADGEALEAMSLEQVNQLFEQLSEGQRDVLGSGAWEANHIGADIPKSLAASVIAPSTKAQ